MLKRVEELERKNKEMQDDIYKLKFEVESLTYEIDHLRKNIKDVRQKLYKYLKYTV